MLKCVVLGHKWKVHKKRQPYVSYGLAGRQEEGLHELQIEYIGCLRCSLIKGESLNLVVERHYS